MKCLPSSWLETQFGLSGQGSRLGINSEDITAEHDLMRELNSIPLHFSRFSAG